MSNEVRERLNDFVAPTGEMFLRLINFLTYSTNQHNWAKNLRNRFYFILN